MYVTDDHAVSAPAPAVDKVVAELRDRAEILDALYRFGLGQDLKDPDLFASSFTVDAELDFAPAAAKWGGRPPLMVGRDTIVTTILGLFTGRVDTTHQVTNPRISVDGDTAHLTALVEAQHLLTADRGTFALLKNPYAVELVRDGDRWLIRRMRIDNAWYTGDPVAIFAGDAGDTSDARDASDSSDSSDTGGATTGSPRVRAATEEDWPAMWAFMEGIVRAGETFSWDRGTTEEQARVMWFPQPPGHTFVAVGTGGEILGTANSVRNHRGGASHIASASFMVDPAHSGQGVGRALGEHVLAQARADGFRAMQFNAVVETNTRAVALWRSLGLQVLGTLPEGFRHPVHGYVGLHVMHRAL